MSVSDTTEIFQKHKNGCDILHTKLNIDLPATSPFTKYDSYLSELDVSLSQHVPSTKEAPTTT